ncbi:LacI family DNA-binding transcriptional regulator [Mycobacterium sp. NPDC006124]|uniref:LacI family DNA-binding transcriptional regulator n=1 Tax=Mycobacterium sp. NPDC006124 TaxID=3156729 RepID=UPI0033A26448
MTIRPAAKKPTVRDVAAAAEVSVATVSRVLAGAPKTVSDKTQRRVLEAAARLGYEVNIAAKSLATGRHGNIAVLVPDLGNQHFTSIVQSVIHASNDIGHHVFVGDSLNSPDLEVSLATEMLLRSDGLILCSPRCSDEGGRAIFDTGKPVVTVNRRFPWAGRTASVQTDAVDATTQIVDTLLDLGHRSFGFVVAQSGSQQVSRRWEVVEGRTIAAGASAVHVALPEPLGEVTVEVRALVEQGCTALVCANDVTAAAVVYAIAEMGLRVPDDVSVTGFDDTPLARWVTPRLTTARMHEDQLGRAAWEAMTQLLLPNPVRADRIFHADVVFRDSSGPAPHR